MAKNDNEITNRVPPQSLESEMAVLGSMLIEKEAVVKVMEVLNEGDFYSDSHRNIFRSIRDLYIENHAIDTITVGEDLKKKGWLSDAGGGTYLMSLVSSVSTAANVEYYAKAVREKSILRKLINAGTEIVSSAFDGRDSAAAILDTSEAMLFEIAQNRVTRGFTSLNQLVHPTLEYLEKLNKDKKDVPGLRTGFEDLDRMTAGLQPSELIILAGRPSMGKTALALNIAEHVAVVDKKPVAIFSIEMSKEALMLRLLCSLAMVDAHKTRQGYISTQNWTKLTTAATKLSEASIFIDDSPNLSVLEVRARARRLATELRIQKQELSMIMIDYLQMLRGIGRSESRQQEMAEISRSLKGLARDLGVPVVALSQLSRKPEEKGREGKPQLSDLRESGALEQDADVVAFIYREGYYKRDDPDVQKNATLILAKQRNGPTGEINLIFEHEFTRFHSKTYETSKAI